MNSLSSRREFGQIATLATATALASARLNAASLTANDVVDRIKAKLAEEGVVWRPSMFDGFHLGDPQVPVTGIAVSFQATFDVLKRAHAEGKNFVVSHECTFWDGFDPVVVMRGDPVCEAKIRFAEQNKMAVWRIHDHWHRRRPDPVFGALARKLGWASNLIEGRPRRYEIAETSLADVARQIQQRLGSKNVVVVGDPALRVKTIGDCIHVLSTVLPALRTSDVALVGETGQYDTFEYVRDAVNLGMKKGLIMISHQALEEWGMEEFAQWVKPAVPDVPVAWLSSGDPFEIPAV